MKQLARPTIDSGVNKAEDSSSDQRTGREMTTLEEYAVTAISMHLGTPVTLTEARNLKVLWERFYGKARSAVDLATGRKIINSARFKREAALITALQRIERQTRGYDSMSSMGIFNEIAREALNGDVL